MWNRVDILTPAHNLRMLEAEWEDCFEFEASLGPQLQKKDVGTRSMKHIKNPQQSGRILWYISYRRKPSLKSIECFEIVLIYWK